MLFFCSSSTGNITTSWVNAVLKADSADLSTSVADIFVMNENASIVTLSAIVSDLPHFR